MPTFRQLAIIVRNTIKLYVSVAVGHKTFMYPVSKSDNNGNFSV